MSQGKAVIATAVGGNLDMVVPDVTGLLVPPADVRALAEAFKLLIHDPALRERLGEAARLSVRGLDAPAIAGRFEQFYGAAVVAASVADRKGGR
jgi:glycosyltransferase involved in cell wall biosynthesis